MQPGDENPYAPPLTPTATPAPPLETRKGRLPIVSGTLCMITLIWITMNVWLLSAKAQPERFPSLIALTVSWAAILSTWMSSVIYRTLSISGPAISSRGAAMMWGAGLVGLGGLALMTVGRPPAAALIPLGVAASAAATFAAQRKSHVDEKHSI